MERGFEPDSCFYIENERLVRGKNRIDLAVDPPPDLIVEIDIASPSLNKFPIFYVYARLKVPETWRYDGSRVAVFRLGNGGYVEVPESVALPPLTNVVLPRFVEESKTLERGRWTRKARDWARERSG